MRKEVNDITYVLTVETSNGSYYIWMNIQVTNNRLTFTIVSFAVTNTSMAAIQTPSLERQ
jgi:hypothetical protein